MRKEKDIAPEAYDLLLRWLSPDRELASQEYLRLQRVLHTFFLNQHCTAPEDLVLETFSRVESQISDLVSRFEGNPARFFYGVARNVLKEWRRERGRIGPRPVEIPADAEDLFGDPTPELECLRSAMARIPEADREFLLDYHDIEGKNKRARREKVAAEHGLSYTAATTLAQRIRQRLRRMVTACIQVKKMRDRIG